MVAWFPKLVPGYLSFDDFYLIHADDLRGHIHHFLSQGRFGMALVQTLLVRLGADPIHAPTLLAFVSIFLLAVVAAVTARLWDLESRPSSLVACALCFVHPYGAEMWSFRLAPIHYSISLLLAFSGAALLRRGRGMIALPIALIAFSLSVYQVSLNPLLVAVALGVCLDLARVGGGRDELLLVIRVWATVLLAIAAACLLYLGANELVLRVLAISPEARNGFVAAGDAPARAAEIARQLPRLLFKERQLGTGLLGALQLALLLLALALAAARARAERSFGKLALTAVLLAAALLAVVGIVGVVRVFWPAPRTLTAVGFYWGGVLALASVLAGPRLRLLVVGAGALLLLGYAGIDHRAAAEQVRINARDLARAGRILERFEQHPRYSELQRIALVHPPMSYGDLHTVTGDLNTSALAVAWSQSAVFEEAAGRPFGIATEQDRSGAQKLCAAAPRWPAQGSVTIEGPVGIVCF